MKEYKLLFVNLVQVAQVSRDVLQKRVRVDEVCARLERLAELLRDADNPLHFRV